MMKGNRAFSSITKYIAIFIAVFVTAVIQTGFFVSFRPFDVAPDLCLALVVAAAIKWGAKKGAIFGIFAGFLLDSFTKIGFSALVLFYFLVAVAIGLFFEDTNANTLVLFLAATSMAALAKMVMTFVEICFSSSTFSLGDVIFKLLIPNFIITLIFSPLLYFAVRLSVKLFGRAEKNTSR